ncbi:hypothetical protein MITS9508_02239 [Synechococcus sp. MIT S9508]|nr:hypothetical protein MITS9508_02239 [Synechococcus sp. MIT S9508]
MSAAGEGVKHKQPSVTISASRELDALLGLELLRLLGSNHRLAGEQESRCFIDSD